MNKRKKNLSYLEVKDDKFRKLHNDDGSYRITRPPPPPYCYKPFKINKI